MNNSIVNQLFKCMTGFAVSIAVVSCGHSDTKEPVSDNVMKDSTAVKSGDSAVFYNFPSALQITSLFKKSGLTYVDGITNPQKDPTKYTSIFSKSLNLGIYAADLAYCVLNKQNQESLNYMKVSTDLASSLGMSSILESGNFGKRFELNIDNEDTLRNIISELQMEADTYLHDNDQQFISTIGFCGAWTEVMYIGTKVFEQSKGRELNDKISEQMVLLSRIIAVLRSEQKKDPAIAELLKEMNGLLDVYNGFDSVKRSKAENKEEELNLTVGLSEQEFAALVKKLADVHQSLLK